MGKAVGLARRILENFINDETYLGRKAKELAQAVLLEEQTTVDSEMLTQELRLHMGELC